MDNLGQGFIVKPNTQQAATYEKTKKQMDMFLVERQSLMERINEIDTASTRLQGRQDGLIAVLAGEVGVDYDDIFEYIWDDEQKVFTIVLNVKVPHKGMALASNGQIEEGTNVSA